LLQAERHAIALAIELEDLDLELLTDADDLRRMLDALPRHVRDVQQAVDTAEVDERAVVGQVLDHAFSVVPSWRFFSSDSRSALYSASTTARRDTTTLLRF